MEFNPPVGERTDKELLNIISNDSKWTREIQTLAEAELIKRNYSGAAILKEKTKRIKIINDFEERQRRNLEKNRNESYSITEMVLIVLFFPFSLFIHLNPLTEFWELDAKNYKKKIWQRIFLIVASLFLWLQVLRLII